MARKIVVDFSVLSEGQSSGSVKKDDEVVIHLAAVAYAEYLAEHNKTAGILGVEELKRLASMTQLKFSGQRPRDITRTTDNEIAALARELAYNEDAILITSNPIQKSVAEAQNIRVQYVEPKGSKKKLEFEKYFDEQTMSVHLKEKVRPYAKRGMPGNWEVKEVGKTALKQKEIMALAREIVEETKLRDDGFIEIEREGSTIVQLGKYRIVISKTPFADGWEITAVRPVKTLELKDYDISEKLKKRISEQAEGILVAGAPGMGKSTFAQALAVHYASLKKTVKTIEAPRDLVLPEDVTQYAISYGDAQEIHDILLLSRPDYTIFDEMRNTDDFRLFADMRLAGVGMVGVVHATNPIDAIQRFLGRIEMGVIPQIVDTVIFIRNGAIEKVLSLEMTVKVPSGMTEADLARPVVVVNNFEDSRLEYEIYSYGEQTVVVPVAKQAAKTGAARLAEKKIYEEFSRYSRDAKVELSSEHKCIVMLPEKEISRAIGKQGSNIERIEKQLGIGIDIRPLEEKKARDVEFDIEIRKGHIIVSLGQKMHKKEVELYIDDKFVMSAKAGNAGIIKIKKNNPLGKEIIEAYNLKKNIRVVAIS